MKLPATKTQEIVGNTPPMLIVDKIGIIGESLAREFSQDFLVVLLSPKRFTQRNGKVIHVPFKRRIPQAPNGRYSKIFIIDDGQSITKKSASSFIQKARENDSPFYFIGSIRNIDVKHADEIAASYKRAQVLIFGDLFDRKIFFDKNASISRFSLQARKNQRIVIEGDGLSLSYPVTFNDTIKLIIKASYLDISQKTILLFSQYPITDISLASKFKKINPEVKIDFISSKKKNEIYIPKNSQFALSKYNLDEKIKDLEIDDKEDREVRVVEAKTKRKNFIKPILAFLLLILFVVLLPFVTTLSYILLGEREIKNAFISSEKGNLEKAEKQIKNSKILFETAEKTSQPLLLEGEYLGMRKPAERIKKRAESGKLISEAGLNILSGGVVLKNIYSEKSRDPKNDFLIASGFFKNAVSLIQRARVEGSLPRGLEKKYEDIEPFIDLFSTSSEVLPDVLGFEAPKKYLVLFQDSEELRPSGGAIENFAILEIRNGKIVDIVVNDEAPIDENLKSIINPPFGLRRYLPLENQTLRDSNFDPDFINSAISASNIYSVALDQKVDGVIAIDKEFVKNILREINFITIKKGEKITVDNIDDFSLSDPEFGTEVLNSLKKSLDERRDISPIALAREVGVSISEKHILFAFPDSSTQNIFTANGWSSSLWDNREKENNKINDYLGISEANLGKNKINKFVSRSVSKKVIISSSGKVSSELTISFKNNAEKGSGVYKNYIQLIFPEASRIVSIFVDGKNQKIEKAVVNPKVYQVKGFKPPPGVEVEERNQMDKNIYGLLIQIPEKEIKTLVVKYEIPYSLPSSQKSAEYSLKLYKQPGIVSFPFDLSFELPQNQKVLNLNENFSSEIKTDKEFNFIISQR